MSYHNKKCTQIYSVGAVKKGMYTNLKCRSYYNKDWTQIYSVRAITKRLYTNLQCTEGAITIKRVHTLTVNRRSYYMYTKLQCTEGTITIKTVQCVHKLTVYRMHYDNKDCTKTYSVQKELSQ